MAAAAAAGAAKGGVSGAALGAARQVTLSTLRDPKRRSRLAWIAALLVGLLLFPLMMVFFAFGAGSSPSGSHANSSIAGSRAVKAGVTRENIEIARRVGLRVGVSWEVLSSLVLVQAQGVSTVVSAGTGATTAASTGPAATDWRVPVVGSYVVTSPFGMRIHPILEIAKLHTGVDLVMKPAPGDVVAAASGTVLWAKPSGAYGNQVAVDHGGGVTTSYSHLASFAPGIAPGVPVSAGQVVGQEGTTGRSTGPHLHFEVRLAGVPVDPVPFMAQHGVTIGSGGSGGAGTGTGTSTGWGMSITGIGPLKINPGSEPPDATDMEAALLWAARAMKEKLPDNIDISSGMVVSDIDAVIDTGNAEATAVRQDYLNGLKALPVGGMSATRANQIYDQAIAWRLGKDYVNPNYGISCDVSAFGSLTVTDGAGRTFTLGPTELGHVATMVTVAKQAGLSERAMIAAAMAMADADLDCAPSDGCGSST